MSTPDESWSASATAHSYGVAGSFVVPTTTIGAAPSAVISPRAPVGRVGPASHGSGPDQYGAMVGASAAMRRLAGRLRLVGDVQRVVHAVVRPERLGRVVEVGAVSRGRSRSRRAGSATSGSPWRTSVSAAVRYGQLSCGVERGDDAGQSVSAPSAGRRPPAAGAGRRSRAACRGRPCASSTVPRNGQSTARAGSRPCTPAAPTRTRRLDGADVETRHRRIDRAVEHQSPDPLGVELRVGRAEERAVRVAEVVQLLVAEHARAAGPCRARSSRS